jgi:Tfp pilus assembly protein PilF
VIRKKDVIPEMHYHLGMVYIEKGRVEEAKLELEKAVVEDAKYNGLETARAELEKLKAM